MKSKIPALGVDLGGTKLSCAVVSDYQIVGDPKVIKTPPGAENILDAIRDLIKEFQKDHLLAGAGIATAGIVNGDTGRILGATGNLPGWTGTEVKKILETETGLAVHVENDANAAAYGECYAQGLDSLKCVVAVTLGTGIGLGVVMEGKLYRGAHWAGAEGGHIRISLDNNRRCTCGLWDCWEAYGSGTGLKTTALRMTEGITAEQSALGGLGDRLRNRDVTKRAAEGDLVAQQILNKWHEHIACGLASLTHVFDPDCFLIGGGMSRFVDFELLEELLSDRVMERYRQNLELRPSSLGVSAGLVGAAHLVADSISAGIKCAG